MSTIGLIENHPISLDGLSYFLNEHYQNATIIGSCNVSNFYDSYQDCKPDIIILSINEETKEECLSLIKQAVKAFPKIPIIAYVREALAGVVPCYLRLGIKGNLLKSDPMIEVTKCIKSVLEGRHYLSPSVLEIFLKDLKNRTESVTNFHKLSTREYQIASYLVNGNRTAWIANQLNLKPSTISTVKKTIFTKMGIQTIIQLQKIMIIP